MTLVVDASVVVAALIDSGRDGGWAASQLVADDLAAPHLMPVEAANVLRRAVMSGDLSPDLATLAHADLVQLRIELFPYDVHAGRIWELRANLTTYDAWYVAVAEALGAPLATLDERVARAAGPTCEFRLLPSA